MKKYVVWLERKNILFIIKEKVFCLSLLILFITINIIFKLFIIIIVIKGKKKV